MLRSEWQRYRVPALLWAIAGNTALMNAALALLVWWPLSIILVGVAAYCLWQEVLVVKAWLHATFG